MEPGVAQKARRPLSRLAEPFQELVRASEGPKGRAQLPAALSSLPHTDSIPSTRTCPPGKDSAALPWLPPIGGPVLFLLCSRPLSCGLLSQPWEEELLEQQTR